MPGLERLVEDSNGEAGHVTTGVGRFVGWVDVSWHLGPHTPASVLRDVVHVVEDGPGALEDALSRARERRAASLRQCGVCGERLIPGHMHSDDVCQGCAEQELGFVH